MSFFGSQNGFVPVHSRHRGRIFPPSAADDPKTAEAMSKVILLAQETKIKDPTIQEQLRVPEVISKPIPKPRENLSSCSRAYDPPGGHGTSNMVDRLTRRMDRHLFSTFYFHGSLASAESGIRGWALIHNFAPCNPTTVKKHDGWRCPADRLHSRFSIFSFCG